MKNSMITAGMLLLAAGCSPRVRVDQSNNADFSHYRTFAFMSNDSSVVAGQNPLYYNQIATQNVERTILSEFAKKGITEANRNPDLLIGYHFFVQNKTHTVPLGYGGYGGYRGYGRGWGRWGYGGWRPNWYGYGGRRYIRQNYEAGTVVVDMVDAKTHKLLWRGSVQNAVHNPANITRQLSREVGQIIGKFPDRRTL